MPCPRHGTPEDAPLGATHALPSQILWIQFGYECNAQTSHTIDFWRMGQVEANTEEVTLDIPQHYHQITWPVCWLSFPLAVPNTISISAFSAEIAGDPGYTTHRGPQPVHSQYDWRWSTPNLEVSTTPAGSWENQFLRRYWTFTGHICRQDFYSRHPARIMQHHVKQQHQSKLNRPGPWNAPHSLISKFRTENELDGDYGHMALDRDAWKLLTQCFLTWNAIYRWTAPMWSSSTPNLGNTQNTVPSCMAPGHFYTHTFE